MTAPNPRNGVSSHSPQLVTDQDGRYQYGVVDRNDWGADVFKRTRATGAMQTFDLLSIPGNLLALPINASDDHHALSIGVHRAPLGDRVWIGGNSHASPRRVIKSSHNSIFNWSVETLGMSATGANAHTYHLFGHHPDGTLLWFLDQSDYATDTRGRDFLAFKREPLGTAWLPLFGAGEFALSFKTPVLGDADRAYVTGVTCEASGRTWVAGLWRTDNKDANSQKRPWCIYSDDLKIWRTVRGLVQPMPITWENSSAADVASAPSFSRNYGQGIAILNGGPHLIYQDQATAGYVECYLSGGMWASRPIVLPGSANGPSIHNINGRLCTITQGGGRIRVRDVDSGVIRYLGGEAPPGMEVNPDPVALRAGRLEVCIPGGPTGDDPAVFTL